MPEGTASSSGMGAAPAAAAVPEVTTSEAFKQHCTDLTGLCIVAALDPSADDFATHKATLQVSFHVLCCGCAVCAVRCCAGLRWIMLIVIYTCLLGGKPIGLRKAPGMTTVEQVSVLPCML